MKEQNYAHSSGKSYAIKSIQANETEDHLKRERKSLHITFQFHNRGF